MKITEPRLEPREEPETVECEICGDYYIKGDEDHFFRMENCCHCGKQVCENCYIESDNSWKVACYECIQKFIDQERTKK